jgi:hypothetical protein
MQQDDAAIENRIAVIKRGREEDSEEGSKRLRIETQAALGKLQICASCSCNNHQHKHGCCWCTGIKSSCCACNSSDRLCEQSEQCITSACLAEATLILMRFYWISVTCLITNSNSASARCAEDEWSSSTNNAVNRACSTCVLTHL